MEPDDSADTLAGLLLFMLALPPIIALFYQSDLDFEQHVSSVKRALLKLFHCTLGRCIKRMWGQPAKAEAEKKAAASEAATRASTGSTPRRACTQDGSIRV